MKGQSPSLLIRAGADLDVRDQARGRGVPTAGGVTHLAHLTCSCAHRQAVSSGKGPLPLRAISCFFLLLPRRSTAGRKDGSQQSLRVRLGLVEDRASLLSVARAPGGRSDAEQRRTHSSAPLRSPGGGAALLLSVAQKCRCCRHHGLLEEGADVNVVDNVRDAPSFARGISNDGLVCLVVDVPQATLHGHAHPAICRRYVFIDPLLPLLLSRSHSQAGQTPLHLALADNKDSELPLRTARQPGWRSLPVRIVSEAAPELGRIRAADHTDTRSTAGALSTWRLASLSAGPYYCRGHWASSSRLCVTYLLCRSSFSAPFIAGGAIRRRLCARACTSRRQRAVDRRQKSCHPRHLCVSLPNFHQQPSRAPARRSTRCFCC